MRNSETKRAVRVAGELHQALAAAVRGLRDPRVELVVLTRVEMTDDLRLGKVWVRSAQVTDAVDQRKALLAGLQNASSRLRREVTDALKLRFSPELRFYFDEGQDAALRVETLLKEIADDDAPGER